MDDETRLILVGNIASLVRSRGNISHICDRIGINRQQFNKYLSGQHLPSQYNLNLICKYFGVRYADIISPDMQIPEKMEEAAPVPGEKILKGSALLQSLVQNNDRRRLSQFTGTYFKYHLSSIYKGSVVRAVTSLRPQGDMFIYSNLERFPDASRKSVHNYVFKYQGFAFLIDDRLFMIDFESVQKNELTFSIYTPILRNPLRFCFGVTSGIAANQYREPYTAKAVLDHVSRGKPTRAVARQATVVAPDDPSLPIEAREYLTS